MADDDAKWPEEVICSNCEETVGPLMYDPSSDASFTLSCGCDLTAADVTASLEETNLIEPMTGKWSNFDKDSVMKGNMRDD